MIEATNQNAIKNLLMKLTISFFLWNHKNLEEKHEKNMGFVCFSSRYYFYLVPNFRSFCLRKVLPWSRVDCVLGCHRRGTTRFFHGWKGFSGGLPQKVVIVREPYPKWLEKFRVTRRNMLSPSCLTPGRRELFWRMFSPHGPRPRIRGWLRG